MVELINKEEFFTINGLCMEVHKVLGNGLLESVYKDALEYEFKVHNIEFVREKEFNIVYKEITLKHKFYADFFLMDKIILEVKATNKIIDENIKQTLNYMAISNCRLGIIANFGNPSYEFKRLVL
ncbi:MAG TPA: GxxExxY protein [Ignavibacteria bacterium]|nr:GxxExxY protein [Ignavibacteria bacterium]